MFIGPVFTSLKDQTANDLALLAKEVKLFGDTNPETGEEYSFEDLRSFADNLVFNSSKLKGKRTKVNLSEGIHHYTIDEELKHLPFLQKLSEDKDGSSLHLIVHDEAHWGIMAFSLLEKFFQRVLEIMKCATDKKPTLLILLVSATSDVIKMPVQEFHFIPGQIMEYTVVWNYLANEGGEAFKTPSYRSVHDLIYKNDIAILTEMQNKMEKTKKSNLTVTERSAFIVASYIKAAQAIAKKIEKGIPTNMWNDENMNMSSLALCELLKCDNGLSGLKKYTPLSPRNKIVLVRVDTIQDAQDLKKNIELCFTLDALENNLPFEVIALTSQNNLTDQLTTKAKKHLQLNQKAEPKTVVVGDLKDIPVFIVVVDMLSMGERLPASCTVFDVRAPYKGSWDSVV